MLNNKKKKAKQYLPVVCFLGYSAQLIFTMFVLLQVLDNDIVLKLERKFLHEIPAEFSGLLEPVSDPEARLKLLSTVIY